MILDLVDRVIIVVEIVIIIIRREGYFYFLFKFNTVLKKYRCISEKMHQKKTTYKCNYFNSFSVIYSIYINYFFSNFDC